ncbi:unnamed protein product, partial [Polarella glacialis]
AATGKGSDAEAPLPGVILDSGLLEREELALPAILHCPRAGDDPPCDAAFCSETCRDAQLTAGHHRLLCVALDAEKRRAWQAFRRYSEARYDTLGLAGLVIAQAVSDVAFCGMDPQDAISRYSRFATMPWPELLAARAADRETWRQLRWVVVHSACKQLRGVFESLPPPLDDLLSEEGFAKLVGMLDLVTKDLERPNPQDHRLRSVLEEMKAPPPLHTELGRLTLAWMTAKRLASEAQEPNEPDSDDEEEPGETQPLGLAQLAQRAARLPLLPGFVGFGLYTTVALTNHSCSPNIEVVPAVYNSDVVGTAQRDIAAGEEITMSYINEDKPRHTRQRSLLKNYGFVCRCARCQAEEGSTTPRE